MPEGKKVSYVRLGNSGLKVSKIILGCLSYGTPEWNGWILPEEESIKHIKAAYDAGINTFDTANVYSNGQSEIVLGKAIKQLNLPRDEIVVMTKVFFTVAKGSTGIFDAEASDKQGYVNQHGLSRKAIYSNPSNTAWSVFNSIMLIFCNESHRFDYETPISETMQALHDVVQAGYARYIGMSSCWAWQFHAMQNYAINNKLTPFISMQNHYNLIYREEEREMFPTLKYLNVGSIPWSPLAEGLLTRPWGSKTVRAQTDKFIGFYGKDEGIQQIISSVERIAKAKNISMAQLSLAWVLSREGVVAPIVGTTSLQNLYDLLGAVDVKLTEEETKELESPYTPQCTYGPF